MSAYVLPVDARVYLSDELGLSGSLDMQGVYNQVKSAEENQYRIPVLDLGALIFYSGNFIADLVINFVFAVPGMINLLVGNFLHFVSLDVSLVAGVLTFLTISIEAGY